MIIKMTTYIFFFVTLMYTKLMVHHKKIICKFYMYYYDVEKNFYAMFNKCN